MRTSGKAFAAVLLAQLAAPGAALGEEVLAVQFPQSCRAECSPPAVGRVSVSGPGRVTIKKTIIPYKSLGYHPNVPISWRMDYWHYNKDFASIHPIPGWETGKAFQQGKETRNWVDGVPVVIEDYYQLDEAETYTGEVKGGPQCWATPNPDCPYWQEGQELHVEIIGGGVPIDEGETEITSDPETWPYQARWDQIAGPGTRPPGWTATPSPLCWAQGPEENPGAIFRCACGDQSYCGSFSNGAVILHWPQGCDKPPVTLRCSTQRKQIVDGLPPSVAGVWDTNDSVITLQLEGRAVRGTYTLDEGRLEGALQGNVVSGHWGELASDRACDTERLGTKYWGRFRFTFSGDAFVGQWGYCEDEPSSAWNGKRRPA